MKFMSSQRSSISTNKEKQKALAHICILVKEVIVFSVFYFRTLGLNVFEVSTEDFLIVVTNSVEYIA